MPQRVHLTLNVLLHIEWKKARLSLFLSLSFSLSLSLSFSAKDASWHLIYCLLTAKQTIRESLRHTFFYEANISL